MRLDISGQFVVSVVTPKGGCSKGRPTHSLKMPTGGVWPCC